MDANPATLDPDAKEQLQRELRDAGYYFGAIDGQWGLKSAAAWKSARVARLVGPILTETDLCDDTRAEFARLWAVATILPEHRDDVEATTRRLLNGRTRYEAVQASTGVPWFFIGMIHGRECDFSFGQHLHNGDPLSGRTVHEPKGRPISGHAPFDWAYSAADALVCDGLTRWTDWSLAGVLHKLEAFNGFGYRVRAIQTPYLWNMTAAGRPGKFVADHVFDPAATDAEAGCAAVLKVLEERGAVTF